MVEDRRTFEERLAACRSSAEIEELCKAAYQPTGTFTRENDGYVKFSTAAPNPNASAGSASQPPIDPAVANAVEGLHLLREVFRMPNGDLREISAYSYSGLDLLHASIEREGGKKIGGNA
jgi:hypothetical protein